MKRGGRMGHEGDKALIYIMYCRRSGGGMNRGGGGGQREPVPQAAQALRWSDPSTQSSYSDR